MGLFSNRSDCTLKDINSRLHELEIQPRRELMEMKRETVTEIILSLEKSEERLGKKLTDSQQKLYLLVKQLDERIRILEAKEHFNKTKKVSKK